MLSSFFSKGAYDLDGYHFKQEYRKEHGGILIDVRTTSEHNSGSIDGAVHIDFLSADFTNEITKLDKTSRYFVFCRSGSRSSAAVSQMRKSGIEAFNLVGGIGSWPR